MKKTLPPPPPVSWAYMLEKARLAGLVDDEEDSDEVVAPDPEPCPDCGGAGEYVLFVHRYKCDRCGGSGY
jgi:DnaJ-class molecular chaperone